MVIICDKSGCGHQYESDSPNTVCPRCIGYGLPIPGCICEYQLIPGTEIKTGFLLHLNSKCSKHQILPPKQEVLVIAENEKTGNGGC